jgi:hypothetical protein
MAHVIEFYIPARFKTKPNGATQEQRGKVIAFLSDRKKSAWEVVSFCDTRKEGQRSFVLNAKNLMQGRSLMLTLASTGGL